MFNKSTLSYLYHGSGSAMVREVVVVVKNRKTRNGVTLLTCLANNKGKPINVYVVPEYGLDVREATVEEIEAFNKPAIFGTVEGVVKEYGSYGDYYHSVGELMELLEKLEGKAVKITIEEL